MSKRSTSKIVSDNNFNLQSLFTRSPIFGMKNMHEIFLFFGQGLKMIL